MGSTDFENEGVLLASLRGGKEEAYAWLFRRYWGLLFNYAGRILHDDEEARDVVQDVFCRLWEQRERLEIRGNMRGYLYGAVYHGCLDRLKHESVKEAYRDEVARDFYMNEVVLPPEVELNLEREDVKQAIEEALGKLPPRCREVFVLGKVEEVPREEIAWRMNVSVKTVETQMRIALARLRKELAWLHYGVLVHFFPDLF